MEPKLQLTRDGSHTLFSNKFDQLYHSLDGAISESLHVFFQSSSIDEVLKQSEFLNILEIGFGTGLNLLLLLDKWLNSDHETKIIYQSIEAYPISVETAQDLNYWQEIGNPVLKDILPLIFNQLITGQNTIHLFPKFEVRLFYGLFNDFTARGFQTDVIFFDAFSPEANPDLWTARVFEKLKDYSKPETIMTTYSAASRARAAMAAAGWYVARAPGALGKREMTIASLSKGPLTGFKRVNEERLAERYNSGEFDIR